MTGGLLIGVVVGLGAGLVAGLLVAQGRQGRLQGDLRAAEARRADAEAAAGRAEARALEAAAATEEARVARAGADAEAEGLRRRLAELAERRDEEQEQLAGAFARLSQEALDRNTRQFLTLADTRMKETQEQARGDLARRQEALERMLDPLQASLTRYEEGIRQIELERRGAYAALSEQVRQLGSGQVLLQKETRNLVTALRSPQARGRWGELQLRRVVEMSGMVAHCDFSEQVTRTGDEGRLRPDMVVHLPGDAEVVVDAKVPLDAYLRAIEADDEPTRRAHGVDHARQVRSHVDQLARKEYWAQFEHSPAYVVAFIPGEGLLSAAYEHDPDLQEYALANRVLLTTPTTLVALLRTVAHGWQQHDLAGNAREVQRLGAELYDRIRVMGGHLGKLQRGLTGAVEAFNETVGSLESRVLPSARRFPDLGVVASGAKEIPVVPQVGALPRTPQAPELVEVTPEGVTVIGGGGEEALPGGAA